MTTGLFHWAACWSN